MTNGLLVAEVARACGVSADTIRHYERKGVIPQAERGENGYRHYPHETIAIVERARRALALGFTLDELARLFRQRAAGKPPCREVRALAAGKLADVDVRIASLLALREELRGLIETWDARLAATPAGEPARLLERLESRRME
jgi:DNA-binding transcriptional MerR regulator